MEARLLASDPDRVTRTEEPGNWEIFAILGVTLVLVFVFLTLQAGVIPVSVIYLFDLLLLTNIALGDARKRIIPNRVVIPATVAVVALSPWTAHLQGGGYIHALSMSTFGWVFCITWMGLAAYIASGRLGGGDIKFAGLIGAMVGIPLAPAAIGVGVAFSGVYALVLVVSRPNKDIKEFPYGPGLSLGCGVLILYIWISSMLG